MFTYTTGALWAHGDFFYPLIHGAGTSWVWPKPFRSGAELAAALKSIAAGVIDPAVWWPVNPSTRKVKNKRILPKKG